MPPLSLLPYYRTLKGTDLQVSPLGLGTVKWGRNDAVKYPQAFDLPDDRQIEDLLVCAQELGINLLDTAPAYGSSEERIGKLLTDRSHWLLCSKVGEQFHPDSGSQFDFSKVAVEHSLHNSLRRLKTDYLDIVLIHSNGDDVAILEQTDVVETLQRAKQQGLIRTIGLSGKTTAGGVLALSEMQLDVAMITYNQDEQSEKPVINYATQHGKNILVKKALGSGHHLLATDNGYTAQQNLAQALQLVFSQPITCAVLGTLSTLHLQQNVALCCQILTRHTPQIPTD